ncbi:MAG TPA: zf-HC2 domain-containing protein [Actinomycetota bacterium]
MSHPHELLADLLDGTLDADARAGVDAHLATCPACREDLAAAAVGRDAAHGLPAVATPADLRDRIVAAAGGGGGSGTPRWYRWAGAAAAAALVGVIALALPEIGGGPGGSSDQAAAPGAAEVQVDAAGNLPSIEVSDRNFREGDLTELASEASRGMASVPPLATAAPGEDPSAAADCIRRAFAELPSGEPVRLIRARFEGTEAYLAVFLEGPGAGEAPDTAVVWVASADACSVLSFAQVRI